MSQLFKIKPLLLLVFLASLFIVEACKKDDDTDSDQIQLLSFGPSPVLRGGDLRFIGTNLDKVTSIVLANNVEVNTFKSKTAGELVIVVPEATVNGKVVLKTPQGDIQAKTELKISEPITITSFSPAAARPGAVISIEGTYLNLIKEVIFTNKKVVKDSAFISHTKEKIEVKVPDDAKTGIIIISNGEADPILVESATELVVTLPTVTQVSPTPVKAGTALTIEGTDLDLTREVTFTGGSKVTSFTSISGTQLVLNVPADAKDGPVKLSVASLEEVTSTATVVMSVPTINTISPAPAKTGGTVTVSGVDLDLVTRVTFGGDKVGAIQSTSATELTVNVPADAQDGSVTFSTAAGKTVTSNASLTMVKPTIGTISPTDIQVNNVLTITGNDLDIVSKVQFMGGTEAPVLSASLTELTVNVPVGTQSGPIHLIANNGDDVISAISLTILASTSATVTSMPASARPGDMIDIVGVNLDVVTQVVFPIDITATMFGIKTETLIQVVVPENAKTGNGTIKLITATGEIIETPVINITGVDPVVDPTLVFFNFDDLTYWWNDTGTAQNDPALSLDGSNYYYVDHSCNGWTGFFWRNGQNNFPGATIGTNVNDYVLKFDINVLDPITGGEFAWRMKGSSGDFWYYWKPWQDTGTYVTNGWVTVTIPLNSFYAGTTQIADLSTITEDFGVAFNNGASQVKACIDNVRFEHL
ncbi:MAG TPA: glycan-binding surface protein [Saprospiraceae bacterium]|nr:glycan-binding surface protein [Saprospiraceae bacterium]HPI05217.1 glycan-binding surface protein [Saprospiraceae bacterium]